LHSGELLRNVFQEAQKKFGSLKILCYPIISDRLYRLKIFISAQKFGNSKTPDARKILGILRIFIFPKNFGHLMKVEEIFHLCPNILEFGKNPDTWKFSGSLRIYMLPDNFR